MRSILVRSLTSALTRTSVIGAVRWDLNKKERSKMEDFVGDEGLEMPKERCHAVY